MLDAQTSARLEVLRFPLIVGVVFIHNGEVKSLTADAACSTIHSCFLSSFVIHAISDGISRAAVPLFFLISAYLFFAGRPFTARIYFTKVRKRARTLLVPLLQWNVATLLAFAIAQALPATKGYFPLVYPLIRDFRSFDYLNAILGITTSPVAFQFWFIRDLMALVLVSPGIALAIRGRTAVPCLAVVSGLWFLNRWPVLWPSVEASLFFLLGAYLSSTGTSLTAFDECGGALMMMFIPVLLLYATMAAIDPSGVNALLLQSMQKLVILLAVAVAWWSTSHIIKIPWLRLRLIGLSGTSFFVYAAHEPLMMVVRKGAFKIVPPTTQAAVLTLYVSIPVLLVTLLVFTYRVLSAAVPKFTAAITRGREKDEGGPRSQSSFSRQNLARTHLVNASNQADEGRQQ